MAEETVNWTEEDRKEHVSAWFLVESMSPYLEQMELDTKDDIENLKVDLRVNGIQVDFIGPMNYLNDQLTNIELEGYANGKAAASVLAITDHPLDVVKQMAELDQGRFAEVLNTLDLKKECFHCYHFNSDDLTSENGYRCKILGTCIGATLSKEIIDYIIVNVEDVRTRNVKL